MWYVLGALAALWFLTCWVWLYSGTRNSMNPPSLLGSVVGSFGMSLVTFVAIPFLFLGVLGLLFIGMIKR